MYHCLYHSSANVYLPTRPSYFISAGIWRGWWLWEECITVFTSHLPWFTYLLGLPTSSLLTSGGAGGFEKNVSLSLPLICQCLLTYSAFPLHLCWHLEGLVALRRRFPSPNDIWLWSLFYSGHEDTTLAQNPVQFYLQNWVLCSHFFWNDYI